ncbi:lipoprotein insertase outer membrane protein LolB [Legionella spiritensis]|uniref:lipoprotein insertase outer membrane protein LolB n=1 Tax=Legionella spiritensis TaxID=452 RepID=UPI000F6EA501|nr:lipoprotein insertase outer membrane protein LolB [Legionella spiritensis]VEG91345.1 molecular chaperone LolB [Legionella spiritensis]
MNTCKRLSIFLLTLLTACAPPRPAEEVAKPEVLPLTERTERTTVISSWEISGAMAARNKNKAWTASINWLQRGANNYQIRLFGPLGSGTVMIDKKGSVVTYRDGPKTVTSNNPDQLLQEQTGIRLPVNNLYYWVRGLPAPGKVQSVKHDRYNHLILLRQDGYTIEYPGYTSVKNTDLPSRIKLQGKGIFIKMVIKKWSV